jgi:hypothetical protein
LEVLPLEKLLQQYSRAGSMAQILLSSSWSLEVKMQFLWLIIKAKIVAV